MNYPKLRPKYSSYKYAKISTAVPVWTYFRFFLSLKFIFSKILAEIWLCKTHSRRPAPPCCTTSGHVGLGRAYASLLRCASPCTSLLHRARVKPHRPAPPSPTTPCTPPRTAQCLPAHCARVWSCRPTPLLARHLLAHGMGRVALHRATPPYSPAFPTSPCHDRC